MSARPRYLIVALLTVAVIGCDPDKSATGISRHIGGPLAARQRLPHADASAALQAVRSANERGVLSGPALVPPGAPLAPFIEARLYALVNVSVHDALNGIIPRFARYADVGPIVPDANAAAAALKAAHDAIVGGAPAAQAATDAWYASEIAALAGSDGLAEGIA